MEALRALAIIGFVLVDWLGTAVVLRSGGHLVVTSPLSTTWVCGPVFFFASGRLGGDGPWPRRRLVGLARPVVPLVGTWAIALVVLAVMGTAPETMRTFAWLVFSPLWLLLVYALLTTTTPVLAPRPLTLAAAAVVGVAVVGVAVVDVNAVAGWVVPYCLGVAWSRGALAKRQQALLLLVGARSSAPCRWPGEGVRPAWPCWASGWPSAVRPYCCAARWAGR
ncbi:hypothetical protein GCM10029964_078300 [Kibdelosporangium lantanae]